jgi:uncharacterized pyridoxal phosphate-containing UPF0001 family protein
MPFQDLAGRGAEVQDQIAAAVRRGGHGQQVKVVAVTKTHPVEAMEAAVAAGFNNIGENKVQEALTKQAQFSQASARARMGGGGVEGRWWADDIRWHLIGHLQRNKVKHLKSFDLFHALDSARLADAINAQFVAGERVDVLVQVNIAEEASKGGYLPDEMEREAARLMGKSGIAVVGVMTMAPLDADEATLRRVFAGARSAREILRQAGHKANELSMGMSQDFVIAAEEGATIVRLGTALFGERTT